MARGPGVYAREADLERLSLGSSKEGAAKRASTRAAARPLCRQPTSAFPGAGLARPGHPPFRGRLCLDPRTVRGPERPVAFLFSPRALQVIWPGWLSQEQRNFSLQKTEFNCCPTHYSVQSLNHVRLFATPWTAACQASLSNTNSQNLFKLMSVMPAKHLILCRPILPPSVFPRNRVFSNGSVICIRWPKYWRFSFSIGPYTEYSELSSFRMHWLDLPAVQGTLKSLLQHHSSSASILWCLAFFVV